MRFLNDELIIDRDNGVPMMQLIGAGLPRCATSSIQTAFESQYIGLTPCMHFAHVAPHPGRSDILLAAMREHDKTRRHKLLHQLFDGFEATTDFPGSLFVDDLMDMYPDAKIVLNKRPGGGSKWEQSIKVLEYAGNPLYYAVCFLWKTDRNIYTIWDLFLKRSKATLGLTDDELLTAKHYDAHNAWVHVQAAKRGLEVFEFEPRDGWEPLCAILSKETPKDEPFPHRNDASEIRMIVRILYARGLISWLVLGGVIYGAAKFLVK
ncbi:uncharacterized protein N7483_007378 [Penicillium malachiteum]|uniref:uncharacterized protein n=1 Tax=Penicillium malachiteum TaxID=1324776 RepID=UPI00254843A4|nr:uncharacterized protein N7483_007378 [Penicillium malachiteum]KAJ5726021.1 hypothetical protein N7483_007378 [Penicillium malachiteum]